MKNQEIIEQFYKAFQQKDYETMNQCYHEEAKFRDPVFGVLNYTEVRAMWKMLCTNAKEFSLTFDTIKTDENQGVAQWQAHYVFSATSNKVINNVKARFTFKEGKILKHSDYFSFYRWSSQALGMTGKLLGWTPMVRKKVSKQAKNNLEKFMKKK